jgi:hypothetical protein
VRSTTITKLRSGTEAGSAQRGELSPRREPKIGDTPVSCRKDSRGDFVTMADAIETLIAHHPGVTAAEISKTLFATENKSERIDLTCRRLIAEGRIKRCGCGTIASPFAYAPKRAMRSNPRPVTAK